MVSSEWGLKGCKVSQEHSRSRRNLSKTPKELTFLVNQSRPPRTKRLRHTIPPNPPHPIHWHPGVFVIEAISGVRGDQGVLQEFRIHEFSMKGMGEVAYSKRILRRQRRTSQCLKRRACCGLIFFSSRSTIRNTLPLAGTLGVDLPC